MTQAHGMVPDKAQMEVFGSNTSSLNVTLGSKILGVLDDQSLGRSAQVSRHWQRLANQVDDLRYAQTVSSKSSLFACILETVGAESNEAARAWQMVKEILEDKDTQAKLSLDLKNKLLKLQPRLLQPEFLILKDHRDSFLGCLSPDRSHLALSPLIQVIEDLKSIEQDLRQSHLKMHSLIAVLSSLKRHYEGFVEALLGSFDRAALLQPKVILSGEGLMNLHVQGFPSYRITQDKALSLLSKDRYGLLLKKNALGSHAVSHQGRVHFKGNTTSTGLPVGMESAAYWFSQVLFGHGMAPTALLTLNEVDMKSPSEGTQARSDYALAQIHNLTSNEFFTSYPHHQTAFTIENPHHIVQASLHVEGISLEDFMKGVESKQYTYDDLDMSSFSEHIFISLLTNPTDGTPGNFMVDMSKGKPYPIVGIDNDMAFGPAIISTKAGKNTFKPSLEIKNVLYCLPNMCEPLSLETRAAILKASPALVLLRWLERLKIQSKLYDHLKETHYQKEGKDYLYLKEHLYTHELHLPLHFPRGLISDLLESFTKLQEKLKSRPAITHEQLFSFLQPLAHRFYQALKTQYETPFLAYQYIHNSHHENIFLEDVLTPYKGEVLASGKAIAQALEDVHLKDVQPTQSDKKHTLDESAQEIWKDLNLKAQARLSPLIELAATSFTFCFSDQMSFHKSWLQNEILFRALAEGISDEGLSFLLSLGLNITVRDPHSQQNALHYAIAKKYPLPSLKLLLNSLAQDEQCTLLNGEDHQGLTLLDEVMEQGVGDSFCHLRALGATQCSADIALKFYKRQVGSNTALHAAFRELMAINGEVDWMISLEELLPPLISKKDYKGVSLTSSTYGDRQLPIEVQNQILDAQNNFIQISNTGNHPVAYAHKQGPLKNHGLYFKLYPALPGLEEAAGRFTRQLLNFGAPYTDLIKWNSSPCLISQEIPGDTLLNTFKTNPDLLAHLHEEDISGMLITAMLINPEDGKPDNYIVMLHPTKPDKCRIVGIDNDQSFVAAIVKEIPEKAAFTGKIRPVAQVKTILYCLDQMNHFVDSNIRSRIINLHPDRFLEIWLRGLKRVNNQHCGLFTSKEQSEAFQHHKCFIGVPFQQGAVRHIYEKFVQLRDLLTLHPTISHIDLLSKLEPRLAKRYQAALSKNISVAERFKEVDRPFYEVKLDSKRGESHTTVTQSGDILRSWGIPLQEKLFDSIRLGKEKCPVQALEELELIRQEKNTETLKSLAARVGDINLLKTSTLEESRVLFLKELDKQKKILKPQEQSAILDYLSTQKDVRELILPNFSALDDVLFQKLSLEHLRILDLRKCTKVTNRSLIHLSNVALGLEELNLSFLNQLKDMGDIGVFNNTPLVFKNLRFLNLTHCIYLKKILVNAPNLHYLNIEGCALLNDQILDGVIEGSPNLQKLVFEGCPLIGEREMRNKWPNFPASYCGTGKTTIMQILESKEGSAAIIQNSQSHNSKEGLKALTSALRIKKVSSLKLHGERTDAYMAHYMSRSEISEMNLARLKRGIGNKGARALASGNLFYLTDLDLESNNITNEGLTSLASGNLTALTCLALKEDYYYKGENKSDGIGDAGLQALAAGNLNSLKKLYINSEKVTNKGIKALKERYPNIEINGST